MNTIDTKSPISIALAISIAGLAFWAGVNTTTASANSKAITEIKNEAKLDRRARQDLALTLAEIKGPLATMNGHFERMLHGGKTRSAKPRGR